MRIDAVGRGGATRRCVRDVNGVARVAWPGGVRHVDVRLEELGGGITDAQLGLLLSVLGENFTETRARSGAAAECASEGAAEGAAVAAEDGSAGNGVEGVAELWELVERASALSAGAGPADFAAPGAAAKTPVPPPTQGADVFATPHSAPPVAGDASPSDAANGVVARYSFSVRTATVSLGQAGGRDLEAGEGGDLPLVSARISALQGVWEAYVAPEGLLWRCDLGAAAVQARAAARALRPDPTGPPRGSAAAVCVGHFWPPGPLTSLTPPPCPQLVDARPEMSRRVLPFVAAEPSHAGGSSLRVLVERTPEMHTGVRVTLAGAEAVGDAGLFLKACARAPATHPRNTSAKRGPGAREKASTPRSAAGRRRSRGPHSPQVFGFFGDANARAAGVRARHPAGFSYVVVRPGALLVRAVLAGVKVPRAAPVSCCAPPAAAAGPNPPPLVSVRRCTSCARSQIPRPVASCCRASSKCRTRARRETHLPSLPRTRLLPTAWAGAEQRGRAARRAPARR